MSTGNGANTPARELGIQLRKERKRPRPGRPKGYRVTDIPKDICAERTLRDLETGQKPRVKPGMVSDLCDFYETDPDLIRELRALAKATQADKWWDYYSSAIDGRYWLFLQREGQANRIKAHDSIYVPALLQHEYYIDAIHRTVRMAWEKDDLDFAVAKQLRLDRREKWLRSETPFTCIIGESALLLSMGDEAMEAQRKLLLSLAELSHVEVLITPLSAGRHDVHGAEFSILEFDDDNENVIHLASSFAGRYIPPESRTGRFFTSGFEFAKSLSIPIKEYLT